jgi:plastocyanin
MSRVPEFLAALACSAAFTVGFAANAHACDSPGKKVTVKVKVENSQPVADPDTVNACVGDTIHWIFAGSDAKEFKVKFMGDDSPFDWSDKKGASVDGTVKAGAVKNGKPTPYDYDVELDGVAADPKIIVDP